MTMPDVSPSPETFRYSLLNTPIGWLTVIVSEKGLLAIRFGAAFGPAAPDSDLVGDNAATCDSVAQLSEYFRGERREFTLPLDLRGTEFQKACWLELAKIPYGQVRTYADIARALGRPAAFRAVGMANHSNPLPIVVPCHRILASDGGLCGYAGGLEIKRKLLRLEGCSWREPGPYQDLNQLRLL